MSRVTVTLPWSNDQAFKLERLHSMGIDIPVKTKLMENWLKILQEDDYYIRIDFTTKLVDFVFYEPAHAMMFKLAWGGK